MNAGQTIRFHFKGEHKPTGARVEMMIETDGQHTHGEGLTCPLCSEATLSWHMSCGVDREVKAAAQCTACKSWFEELTDGPAHEPLTLTFE